MEVHFQQTKVNCSPCASHQWKHMQSNCTFSLELELLLLFHQKLPKQAADDTPRHSKKKHNLMLGFESTKLSVSYIGHVKVGEMALHVPSNRGRGWRVTVGLLSHLKNAEHNTSDTLDKARMRRYVKARLRG